MEEGRAVDIIYVGLSKNYSGGTLVEKTPGLLLIQLSPGENKVSVASDFLLLYNSTT